MKYQLTRTGAFLFGGIIIVLLVTGGFLAWKLSGIQSDWDSPNTQDSMPFGPQDVSQEHSNEPMLNKYGVAPNEIKVEL